MSAIEVERRPWSWMGVTLVRLVCGGCGWPTNNAPLEDEPIIARDMREHLADEHLAELDAEGLGPCAVCRQITDHLKAVSQFGSTYLCPAHAPEHRLRDVLGDPNTTIEGN